MTRTNGGAYVDGASIVEAIETHFQLAEVYTKGEPKLIVEMKAKDEPHVMVDIGRGDIKYQEDGAEIAEEFYVVWNGVFTMHSSDDALKLTLVDGTEITFEVPS